MEIFDGGETIISLQEEGHLNLWESNYLFATFSGFINQESPMLNIRNPQGSMVISTSSALTADRVPSTRSSNGKNDLFLMREERSTVKE